MPPPRTLPAPEVAVGSPGSTSSLRAANLQRVLGVLRGIGAHDHPVTQAELARRTGLAPATVSTIVRDLGAAGTVTTEAGSGRRGTTVRISRGAGLVAGVDFGHSHLSVALADLTGTVIAEQRRPLPHGHDHRKGLGEAARLLAAMLATHAVAGEEVGRIGLGLPAPISHDVVASSAILPGWQGVEATVAARAILGVPVTVENDANLGALAEHRYGVARGHDSSFFVKISSGVGAGIVLGGQIFRGADGSAGEIGHLTLDEQGPVCRCGSRGCLEAYASAPTVQAMLADQMPGATLDDILGAARGGHVAALRTLEDAGLHLGWAVAAVVNLINPGIVVIGGDMARAGDLLLDSVRVGLRRHALDAASSTSVLPSALGERASLVGAVVLAAEETKIVL